MLSVARHLFRSLGIDRAIGFTVISRGWLAIAGLVSLALVSKCLTATEQGFYYTFASLLALQVFVELGLTNVIMQYASHERATLEMGPQGTLEGCAAAKSRLAGLLRLAIGWYGISAVIFVAVLLAAGFVFFSRNASVDVRWQLPWVGTVIATAGMLTIMPLLAFLEGCGLVADIARFRFLQAVAANLVLWLALLAGAGLAAAVFFAATNVTVAVLWLFTRQRALLGDLMRCQIRERLEWRRDIWPYQWRIALSWLSGYCIFQLFTPVMFAFHGPAEAGRMGMALTLAGAVSSLSASWLTTKAPRFGILVSRRQFVELDSLFVRSATQATCVATIAAVFAMGVVMALPLIDPSIANRLIAPLPFALLLLATVINVVVLAEAVYLRAFKREPFLWISLLNAIFIGSWTCCIGPFYGALGMMVGYPIISAVVGLGLGTWVFRTCRRVWHVELGTPAPLADLGAPCPSTSRYLQDTQLRCS